MVNERAIIQKIKKLRLMVVMGGTSAERAISLLTGQAMADALSQCQLNVTLLDLKNRSDIKKIIAQKPDVVINGLHGPGGEDGAFQGFLQWMGIPCTGSGLLTSALAMDKHQAKLLMRRAGVPTATWFFTRQMVSRLPQALRYPVVVKPNQQGSAMGIAIVHQARELKPALRQALSFGQGAIIETYIAGQELSVGVLNGRALPVIEIIPKHAFYDYEAKYGPGLSDHVIPARLGRRATTKVKQLAEQVAALFNCQGTPRIDFIMNDQSEVMVLEVNTLPGMTATSLLPEAAAQAGISFTGVILHNIIAALDQQL